MDVSYIWSLLGFVTLVRSFLPAELTEMLDAARQRLWQIIFKAASSASFHIPESNSSEGVNHLYRTVHQYFQAVNLCIQADELVLSRDERETKVTVDLADGEIVADTYKGVTVWWSHKSCKKSKDDVDDDVVVKEAEFLLKMRKNDKDWVMGPYLDYVTESAAAYRRQVRDLHIYNNMQSCWWSKHNFQHPSTLETMAMDPTLKARLLADLQAFTQGKSFFRKVGRAWKRGYLLYGPPGTGKSSLIAAIANYLKYDIYDLELTKVSDNNELKQLLVNTSSQSIIVIEDIDCSLDICSQRTPAAVRPTPVDGSNSETPRVTLSGLLNFTDGLWSSSGDERIIIFTTNHVEKLDPALLRPGRMDMHIQMSYCNFATFRALARTYLSTETHPLFDAVERCLESEGRLVTPAEVTEFLFENKDDPTLALEFVVTHLQKKKEEQAEGDPPKSKLSNRVALFNTGITKKLGRPGRWRGR